MRCIMPIIKYTLNNYWMGVCKKKKEKVIIICSNIFDCPKWQVNLRAVI